MVIYELKKLIRQKMALVILILTALLCVFSAFSANYKQETDSYKQLCQLAQGPLNIETYAALTDKYVSLNTVFYTSVFDSAPFDSEYQMKEASFGYAAGESIDLSASAVYSFEAVTAEQQDAVESVYRACADLFEAGDNLESRLSDAQNTLLWFDGQHNYLKTKAQREKLFYEAVTPPDSFLDAQSGKNMLDGFIGGMASLLFVTLFSAQMAGAERHAGTQLLIGSMPGRKKVYRSKLLCVPILSAGAVLLEAAASLAVYGAQYALPALFFARMQNIYPDAPLNFSVLQFFAAALIIKILAVSICGFCVCLFTAACKNRTAGAVIGGVFVLGPRILGAFDFQWTQALYRFHISHLACGTDLWSELRFYRFFSVPLTGIELLCLIWFPVAALLITAFLRLNIRQNAYR